MNKERSALQLNARTVKFILCLDPEDEHDKLTRTQKTENLQTFLQIANMPLLKAIYEVSISADSYSTNPKFKDGFKMVEQRLLEQGGISIEEVNKNHRQTSVFDLTVDKDGVFRYMDKDERADEIVAAYSRMKFGSPDDIAFFAEAMASKYVARFDDPEDNLLEWFEQIRNKGEHIVIVAAGYRNVESAANLVIKQAAELINIELALRDLPTMVVGNLSRLGSHRIDYATLSKEERAVVPAVADHILPGKELYRQGVHLIYGDDVKITGTTADGVEKSAEENGAKSFSALFALQIDPIVAAKNPAIEHALNHFEVTGKLDIHLAQILNHPEFRPVQRLLRLLFNKTNRDDIKNYFQSQIEPRNAAKIYVAALNNEYLADEKYRDSVKLLGEVVNIQRLKSRGTLDF